MIASNGNIRECSTSVFSDTSSRTYQINIRAEITPSDDSVQSSWCLFPDMMIGSPINSSMLYIDSVSNDSLWGEYLKDIPVRAIDVESGESFAVALGDSVKGMLGGGSVALWEVTDLFAGTGVDGYPVQYAEVVFYRDDDVGIADVPAVKRPQLIQGKQEVKIFSANGRLIHRFTSDYSAISGVISSLNLSRGVYFVKTPYLSEKFLVR